MSQYGVTFAQKLLDHGDYDKAIVEAEAHMTREPDSPEPYHDRARARALLGQQEGALADYRRALELDQAAQILPEHELDDGLFSLLLGWSQKLSGAEQQVAVLARYREILPGGAHLQEVDEWSRRFRGLIKTSWTKPR